MDDNHQLQSIVLGGGCFWCLEAVFQRIKGVSKAVNGYAGGNTIKPSYESVCGGSSGHAEVVEVTYSPQDISLDTLFTVFWTIHNPTTLNQQGADIGTQYRSVIFYSNQIQKDAALGSLKKTGQAIWNDPVVTEILPLEKFWPAEKHHQNYFNNHPDNAYCQVVINPKVSKLKKKFSHLLIS